MTGDLKPNNCTVNFECTNPKKCVHYKRVKQEPKPCKTCTNKDCQTNYMDDYCWPLDQWKENKSMCRHNQGRYGECYNMTAHLQAITKCLKSIGVSVTYGGLKND